MRAQRTQSKAARVGFDWPDARAAWEKVREEVDEAGEALAAGDRDRIREELGWSPPYDHRSALERTGRWLAHRAGTPASR